MEEINEFKLVSLKDIARYNWIHNSIVELCINANKENYNKIPVYWCNSCKSLNIMNIDLNHKDLSNSIHCYCNDCTSTDIIEGQIEDWEILINNNHLINK